VKAEGNRGEFLHAHHLNGGRVRLNILLNNLKDLFKFALILD